MSLYKGGTYVDRKTIIYNLWEIYSLSFVQYTFTQTKIWLGRFALN